jgi:hypothetical protein
LPPGSGRLYRSYNSKNVENLLSCWELEELISEITFDDISWTFMIVHDHVMILEDN